MSNPKLEKMFKTHAAIKAKRSDIGRAFKEADDKLKHQIELIETGFLKIMNDTGSDQLKVKGLGIASRSERMLASGHDWNAVWNHIQESGNFDLLQKRLAIGGVKDHMETHKGDTPPGVSITIERGVSVRRQN